MGVVSFGSGAAVQRGPESNSEAGRGQNEGVCRPPIYLTAPFLLPDGLLVTCSGSGARYLV